MTSPVAVSTLLAPPPLCRGYWVEQQPGCGVEYGWLVTGTGSPKGGCVLQPSKSHQTLQAGPRHSSSLSRKPG